MRRGGTAAAGSKRPACAAQLTAAGWAAGLRWQAGLSVRRGQRGRCRIAGSRAVGWPRATASRRETASPARRARVRREGKARGGALSRDTPQPRESQGGLAPCTGRRASSGRRWPPPLHAWHGLRDVPRQVAQPSPSALQRVHAQASVPLPWHTGHADSCGAFPSQRDREIQRDASAAHLSVHARLRRRRLREDKVGAQDCRGCDRLANHPGGGCATVAGRCCGEGAHAGAAGRGAARAASSHGGRHDAARAAVARRQRRRGQRGGGLRDAGMHRGGARGGRKREGRARRGRETPASQSA
jgi:hypothetical protein